MLNGVSGPLFQLQEHGFGDGPVQGADGEAEGAPSDEQERGGDDEDQDRDEEQRDPQPAQERPVLVATPTLPVGSNQSVELQHYLLPSRPLVCFVDDIYLE